MTSRVVSSLLAFSLGMVMWGCVTAKPADFMAPQFQPSQVDKLVVLPVLDHRVDRQGVLDLDARILPIAERELTRLGYGYVVVRDRQSIEGIAREDLESPSSEWIGTLGPPGTRWVMTLVLEASSSSLTFGSTGLAEMTGYLFDKQTHTLLWKNKELGQVGQGGLFGMMMKGMMEGWAIETAAELMFRTLPDRRQSKP